MSSNADLWPRAIGAIEARIKGHHDEFLSAVQDLPNERLPEFATALAEAAAAAMQVASDEPLRVLAILKEDPPDW